MLKLRWFTQTLPVAIVTAWFAVFGASWLAIGEHLNPEAAEHLDADQIVRGGGYFDGAGTGGQD